MIRTQNLTKKYRGVEALEELTLEVPKGSVFALVGPNGAGKTTAIKSLMNIIRPTSGRSEVLGTDSQKLGPKQLAQIGYVSENQQLPEWMKTGYFLNYCKPFYPTWDDELAASLVKLFELPLDRKLRALSRGMKIKAALASSLAYRPRLIVLDEPFSGLDALVRDQLIESVLDRASEATVFIASHDLAEIESFASHVGYIEAGRLKFAEEMSTLSARFREIEVTLEATAQVPADWPAHWLNPEQTGVVVRFTDSRYERERTEAEIRSLFAGTRNIEARSMPLRAIFVSLAKSSKQKD
jgi:ABC-2 type transport system ATP-binding protein